MATTEAPRESQTHTTTAGTRRAREVRPPRGGSADDPEAAIAVARDLGGLERVQPRIDRRLKAYVTALVDERTPQAFGEGPA